ncbi:MAG: diphthamide biosynthesis enzyme Dph2 [Methanomassiliicoccaceae archaeon]|jgi:2-(3-amino-3-carboxypropyl)histidine synthase|nr:diphthamide biosynthesis enzyme Dph2 [Methanomassiliicoccaceae archaeon]
MFDLRLDDITEWIRCKCFSSVAIQLPEGLKIRATEIADHIFSNTNVPVIILGDPCYGACDLYVNYKGIADGLVHFGHSPIPSISDDKNILFVEALADLDIRKGIRNIADALPKKVGLLATVQYINTLKDAKDVLEDLGKKVLIGKGDGRLKYDGQVLGCNCSAAESVADGVDCFLYIGEGDFHPLAAAFGVGKEIKVFNPITNELRLVDDVRDRILRKRFAAIEKAKDARSFLVIVCTKAGQRRDRVADELIKNINSTGRKAYKTVMEEITPDSLLAYRVDAYVNTACPRLAMDDSVRYGKPILTPPEAEVAIGLREWDDYEFDAIRD